LFITTILATRPYLRFWLESENIGDELVIAGSGISVPSVYLVDDQCDRVVHVDADRLMVDRPAFLSQQEHWQQQSLAIQVDDQYVLVVAVVPVGGYGE